jgi:hypothetical protein
VGSRGAEHIDSMRVFDSNILIYHLNDALPPLVSNQVESWITEGAVISVMSRIEVSGDRAGYVRDLFIERTD